MDTLQYQLSEVHFSKKESGDLKKFLQVFFLGQLVGLPTLHSILARYGIKSNKRQIDYKLLCKKLTITTIRKLFESLFEQQLFDILQKMSQKDSSCWSKNLVTAVLDDSIFKQWLSSQDKSKDFEDCYGSFFSGQYSTPVYGFKVVTFGLCIQGILYPLYFDYVKKATPDTPSPEKATQIAQKLVKRWGEFVKRLQNKGIPIPRLHFSCDNGYSNLALSQSCFDNALIYISVPKKSHFIELIEENGHTHKVKLTHWIDTIFVQAEKQHQETQQILSKDKKTPFVLRFRAIYCAQNQEVSFLAFRLKGSNKVSIIYCTDKNIFAKTPIRHWFQRTYIEQFFKCLKQVLKIQEARIQNKTDFEVKLWRFAFMAWHVQKLVCWMRKKLKEFQACGFITIQRILCDDMDCFYLLQRFLNKKN